MDRNLKECLENNVPGKYILPFFWQHGEEHSILEEEIDAIKNSGITEFCVESRTHEQFGEDKWWDDFGFILKCAKDRNMRVWLLDDKHFPTGYANGYLDGHPELRKWYLKCDYRDFAGPQRGTSIIALPLDEDFNEEYLSVVAFRRNSDGNCTDEYEVLTDKICDGLIRWDIPSGLWRVFFVRKTRKEKQHNINMLDAESCRAMIYAVYQPHYDHYSEYFGNTFAGFFSDEPCFGNDNFTYYSELGRDFVFLPWAEEFERELAEESGLNTDEVLTYLPALWQIIEGKTAVIRENYMEAATKAYSRNFNRLLGDWSREHDVEYIGHIIEDMNVHQRLGPSAGHFFRSMEGQDMSGIDIVLHQIIPGFNRNIHRASISDSVADPAFFRDTLPKLGSSLAHIDPLKKNRAMCEIFGAFGWAEGLWEMKHMTDLMLSGGINHFVPHAFSPRYPDGDCPPHFYSGGNNCQYDHFGYLMGYMKRSAHVLSDGVHRADVAVYYNAEAEWSGGKHQHISDVCPILAENQIDFDIIPADTLLNCSAVENGLLKIHEETYRALIVPFSEILPERTIRRFSELSGLGVRVIYVNGAPTGDINMKPVSELTGKSEVISADELASGLSEYKTIKTEVLSKDIRIFRTDRNNCSVFMIWNSDIFSEFDSFVDFKANGAPFFYDCWNNKCFAVAEKEGRVRVKLAPGESIFVVFSDDTVSYPAYDYRDGAGADINADWCISVRKNREREFVPVNTDRLVNIAETDTRFSGTIMYETTFNVNGKLPSYLDLGYLSESCEVYLNDVSLGVRVTAPFRYDISEAVKDGENRLRIFVLTNQGMSERDGFSTYLPLPPAGILGPVTLS